MTKACAGVPPDTRAAAGLPLDVRERFANDPLQQRQRRAPLVVDEPLRAAANLVEADSAESCCEPEAGSPASSSRPGSTTPRSCAQRCLRSITSVGVLVLHNVLRSIRCSVHACVLLATLGLAGVPAHRVVARGSETLPQRRDHGRQTIIGDTVLTGSRIGGRRPPTRLLPPCRGSRERPRSRSRRPR